MLTQEYLKSILHYNPETGIFTWLIKPRMNVKMGSKAGWLHKYGYIHIGINKKSYTAHRLAWLYIYGKWPKVIDHINGNRSDNRFSNLRECSFLENSYNQKTSKNNTSGVKGVHFNKKHNKWYVRLAFNGKRQWFGAYTSLEEATKVSIEIRNKYHGEFANHE